MSHLRFEGSDPTADEAVSFRLLSVIEIIISSPTGNYLGDVDVCEMLEAVLTICCQMRRGGMLETLAGKSLQPMYFTEVLKRSAEATMHSLVRTVFSRLKDLEPNEAENQLTHDEEAEKVRTETAAASQTTEDPVGTTAIEGITTRPDVTVSSTPALSSSSCEYIVVPQLACFSELNKSQQIDPTDYYP